MLAPGAACCIHHNTFADLFPPGEPDDFARWVALAFAEANGCIIDNRPSDDLSI